MGLGGRVLSGAGEGLINGAGGGVISGAGGGANKWGQGGEAYNRRFMVCPSLKGWCFFIV